MEYTDGDYLSHNPDWHEGDAEWKVAQLSPLIDEIEFRTAVEVGCGAGALLELMAARYPHAQLSGFDISPALAPFWRQRRREISFHCADFVETRGGFDLLLLIDVFEPVPDSMGFLEALRPRARRFVFHIPLDLFALAVLTNNFSRKRAEVGHLHFFTRSTALAALADCGYRVIDQKLTRPGFRGHTRPTRLLKLPRLAGEKIMGPSLNARVLGGYSLAALAE